MQAVQHYVPQFLLRNFSSGKKPRLWVFDKSTEQVFQAHVRNVAAERRFYDLTVGQTLVSLEAALGALETLASTVVRQIVSDHHLRSLTSDDRAVIASFVAVQIVRVRHHRERLLALDRSLREEFRARGIDAEQIANYKALTRDDAKFLSIQAALAPDEYAKHILDKTWLLFETKPSHPFYIGDNPVTLQNLVHDGPRGNLGIAARGIEIYLPISSTLALGFYCRSHEEKIRSGLERYRSRALRNPELAKQIDFGPVVEMHEAMTKGNALGSTPENVENQNSLQVWASERFVFSAVSDFSLPKTMIRDDPKYKTGPRLEIAR
jgi:hypothetical protein